MGRVGTTKDSSYNEIKTNRIKRMKIGELSTIITAYSRLLDRCNATSVQSRKGERISAVIMNRRQGNTLISLRGCISRKEEEEEEESEGN